MHELERVTLDSQTVLVNLLCPLIVLDSDLTVAYLNIAAKNFLTRVQSVIREIVSRVNTV